METAQRLIAILGRELGVEIANIRSDQRLREDLGMDSIVALNLIFSAERELGLVVTEEQVVNLRTVGDLERLAHRLGDRTNAR